jgi:hypothetical protein
MDAAPPFRRPQNRSTPLNELFLYTTNQLIYNLFQAQDFHGLGMF